MSLQTYVVLLAVAALAFGVLFTAALWKIYKGKIA